jgi:hypothetical protein
MMAHFARLDENNIVIRVHVVNNDVITKDGKEDEALGVAFLTKLHGAGTYVQTSYNHNFRKNYAGVGMLYDVAKDAFYRTTSPYASWTFDEDTCRWTPPTPMPETEEKDGKLNFYEWDEDNVEWKTIEVVLD